MNEATESVLAVVNSHEPALTAAAEIKDYPVDGLDDMIALRGFLDTMSKAARTLRLALDDKISAEIGTNGAYRYGDTIYQAKAGRAFKITNPTGAIDWLGSDLPKAINPVNAIQVSKLKAIAKERGTDLQAVLDSFGEYQEDGKNLSVLPIDKAPIWMQKTLTAHGKHAPRKQALEAML
ncbi:MAG: hypothetical protein ACR2M4_12485 [Actinomycetota bacterium]